MDTQDRLYPEGTYPTMEEVLHADHEQLARWSRFLPSADDNDRPIQYEIHDRFAARGGWNSALSKKIGWTKP